MKYVALYPRVSTQEQAKEGYSIDEQIERLKNYCKAMGWNNYKIYVDAGYSGGNMNRPALQNMIKDIEAGIIEKVVVYKLDRLSRSQKDTLNLIEDVFLANGVDFVSMNENFDTSTPFGRAMVGILAVFAQLEREQIKERMNMGREGRAKEGKYHGGACAPIGYDYIDGELLVNEYEKMQILDIYDMYLKGMPLNSIEKLLRKKGVNHKYGYWDRMAMKRVMTNKLYCGYVSFNNQYHKGQHEAIVSEDLMEKASKLLEERAKKYAAARIRNGGYVSYLGGLVNCGNCGAKYFFYRVHRKNGKIDKYYTCHSRRKAVVKMIKDPNCKNPNFREADLDEAVFAEIKKLALEPDKISKMRDDNRDSELHDKIALLESEIKKIDGQRSRLMDLYSIGQYTIDEIQAKTEPLNDQKKLLSAEIDNLKRNEAELTEEKAVELVTSFEDVFERGDFDEIRMLLESLIDKIIVKPNGDLTIYWKFA